MVRHYVLKELTFATASINGIPGIIKDTMLTTRDYHYPSTHNPDCIMGGDAYVEMVADGTKDPDWVSIPLFRIQNVLSYLECEAVDIVALQLQLYYTGGIDTGYQSFALATIDEGAWDEAQTSYNSRLSGVPWVEAGGLSTKSGYFKSYTFGEGTPVASTWVNFDLFEIRDNEIFDLIIVPVPSLDIVEATQNEISFTSLQNIIIGNIPRLYVKYKVYSPNAFDSQDAMLKIAPYEENPLYPKLTWGKIEPDSTFSAIKIYRKTSAFTNPVADSATLIKTITDITQTEYVNVGFNAGIDDLTTLPVAGTQYFYMVIVEGTDTTGDDATFSNVVSFTVANLTTCDFNGSTSGNVGASRYIELTSTKLIRKVYVDWGDGSTSWYTIATAKLSLSASEILHYFTRTLTAVQFSVRIEDTDGFWSLPQNTVKALTLSDIDPIAKLQVNVREVYSGDNVSLIATLSQPKASNATITQYRFDKGHGEGWSAPQASPVFTFATTAYAAATYTALVEITTSTGKTDTDSATYAVVSATATALEFSNDTSINDIEHTLPIDGVNDIPLDSAGVEYFTEMTRGAEKIIVHGTSTFPNLQEDIDIIRAAWTGGTYISITTKEKDGTAVTYSGRIDGDISIGQSFQNVQGWSFPMIVFVRS